MAKNMATSAAVSVVLAAVIVAVFNSNDNGKASAAGSDSSSLLSGVKSFGSIDDICALTDFVEPCKRVLSKANSASNTTEIIQLASAAVQEEINNLLAQSADMRDLADALKDPKNQNALDSCRAFIRNSLDDIEAVIYAAALLKEMPHDLRNWMSGVMADVSACLMELEVGAPEIMAKVKEMMGNTSQLTRNGMRIVTGYAATVQMGYGEALEGIDFAEVVGGGGEKGEKEKRRLLSEEEGKACPEWMESPERKLLSSDNNAGLTASVVVAQDGSGDVKTIMEAVKKCPAQSEQRFVIYVRAGIYKEHVVIDKQYQNIFMYGDGSRKTVVTGDLNFAIKNIGTAQTASFTVLGKGFVCKNMGFENTAGPEGHQAVALAVEADRSAFFNCRITAYQDTLYIHKGWQYYSNCVISGTVDFIFGQGAAVIQNSLIIVRKPMKSQFNAVTADGHEDKAQPGGIVIQNCKIVPEKELMPVRHDIKSYLGRPWKSQSTAVIMESDIGDVIHADGWNKWNNGADNTNHETCFFAEFNNRGPGGGTSGRVDWSKKNIDKKKAAQYTADAFIQGKQWIAATGAQFTPGFIKS